MRRVSMGSLIFLGLTLLFFGNAEAGLVPKNFLLLNEEWVQRLKRAEVYEATLKVLFGGTRDVARLQEADSVYSLFFTDHDWDRVLYIKYEFSDLNNQWEMTDIRAFGWHGSGTGLFTQPRGIAVDTILRFVPGWSTYFYYLYIADTGNDRIAIWRYDPVNTTFEHVGSITQYNSQSDLNQPQDVFLTVNGNFFGGSDPLALYVADTGNNRIVRFSGVRDGWQSIYTFGSSDFNYPSSVSAYYDYFAPQRMYIYVCDRGNDRIGRFQEDIWGEVGGLITISVPNSNLKSVDLYEPSCDGNVYVADAASCKIRVYDFDLTSELYYYGSCGEGTIQFKFPHGLSIWENELGLVDEYTDNTGPQYFNIVPSIRVTSPHRGMSVRCGATLTITWSIPDYEQIRSQRIYYSLDNGENWIPIVENLPGSTRFHSWPVPDCLPTDRFKARVKVEADDFCGNRGYSVTNAFIIGLAYEAIVAGVEGCPYVYTWDGAGYQQDNTVFLPDYGVDYY